MRVTIGLVILVHRLCSVLSDDFDYYQEINLPPLGTGEDVGDPLILTPYLKSGDIQKARELASVPFPTETELISYSGFFTVNKSADSNMFFWFFRARENPDTAPTLIWLQGGPGVSSLYSLFEENGPVAVNIFQNLRYREYSWHINHNLIYFDNPVGTGFSWSDEDGYARNEIQVGDNLYEAMSQFYIMFPELRSNPLFISGQSYAGKYVPALGYKIHQMNAIVPKVNKMNLAGLLIGNGLSDPINQIDYGDFLYQLGFLDSNYRNYSHQLEEKTKQAIRDKDFENAFDYGDKLIKWISEVIELPSIYNYIKVYPYGDSNEVEEFLNKPETRKAIHVGNATFHNDSLVFDYMKNDFFDSVAPWISELLGHYKVCIYTGQMDLVVGYPLTANYLHHLDFKDKDLYLNKNRTVWKVDGDVAGYVKEAGNLVEVLIRNAGHIVAMDKPKWALDMLLHITNLTQF